MPCLLLKGELGGSGELCQFRTASGTVGGWKIQVDFCVHVVTPSCRASAGSRRKSAGVTAGEKVNREQDSQAGTAKLRIKPGK